MVERMARQGYSLQSEVRKMRRKSREQPRWEQSRYVAMELWWWCTEREAKSVDAPDNLNQGTQASAVGEVVRSRVEQKKQYTLGPRPSCSSSSTTCNLEASQQ